MRQWIGSALVKIMPWDLMAPSYYLNQCLVIINYTLGKKPQWNSNQNTKIFIHENAPESIVCEMEEILSRVNKEFKVSIDIDIGMIIWRNIFVKTNIPLLLTCSITTMLGTLLIIKT